MNAKTILGWRLFLIALICFFIGESASATSWKMLYRDEWDYQTSIMSSDGSLLAVGVEHYQQSSAIFVSRLDHPEKPLKLSFPEASASYLGISADNKYLAAITSNRRTEAGGFQDHLRIWRLDGGKLVYEHQFEPQEPAGPLKFNRDGSRIYLLTIMLTRVFDMEQLKFVDSLEYRIVRPCWFDVSADGKQLAIPNRGSKPIRIASVEKNAEEQWFSGEEKMGTDECKYSPDGKYLAGHDDSNGKLFVWDIKKPDKPLYVIEHRGVNHFMFSPDSKSIAVVQNSDFPERPPRRDEYEYPYQDVMLTVYNVADGKHIAHTPIPRQAGEVTFPYFTPDSKKLFISSMCPEECLIEMNFK